MRKLLITFIAFMILAYNLVAEVGVVATVKGEAYIQRSGKKIRVNSGNFIEKRDIVITKEDSKVQLIFNDKTVVTIGKSSRFSIKEYLFEDAKKSKVTFGMTKGLFRTITGKIGKIAPKKFKLKTKNATIGIRGTEIIIEASPTSGDKIACTQGAISVISNFNGKSVYVEAGKITEVKPNSSPTPPREFKAGDIDKLDKKLNRAKESSSKKEQKSENIKTVQSKGGVNQRNVSNNQEPKISRPPLAPVESIEAKQHSNMAAKIDVAKEIVNITENLDTIVENSVNTQNLDNIMATVNSEVDNKTTNEQDSTPSTADDEAKEEAPTNTTKTPSESDGTPATADGEAEDEVPTDTTKTSSESDSTPATTDDEAKEEAPTYTTPATTGSGSETSSESENIAYPPNVEVSNPSESTTVDIGMPNPSNSETIDTPIEIETIENSSLEETVYSDDYMSFGYWMDSENSPIDTWVSGVVSPVEVVEGYITDHIIASYSGDVVAVTNGKVATGSFDMSIDFGSQTLSGVMQFQATDEPFWKFEITDGLVTPYYFESQSITTSSESEVEGISGTINGNFYGPNVESIGGSFQLNSISSGPATGVFGGAKE